MLQEKLDALQKENDEFKKAKEWKMTAQERYVDQRILK